MVYICATGIVQENFLNNENPRFRIFVIQKLYAHNFRNYKTDKNNNNLVVNCKEPSSKTL